MAVANSRQSASQTCSPLSSRLSPYFALSASPRERGSRRDRGLGDFGGEAAGFAVAFVGGAGEHVDLRAAVVDVVFARDVIAREGEERGQRIAKDRAARVADMERAGRVGADVFHVHAPPCPEVGPAIAGRGQHRPHHALPDGRGETQVSGSPDPRRTPRRCAGRRSAAARAPRRWRAAGGLRAWPAPSRHSSPCPRARHRAAVRPRRPRCRAPRAHAVGGQPVKRRDDERADIGEQVHGRASPWAPR